MVTRFEALGRDVDSALDVDALRVAALLAERDALLGELTAALAVEVSIGGAAVGPVHEALGSAKVSTATLITKVAERTDALRSALRDVSRTARATAAYGSPADLPGHVNARR